MPTRRPTISESARLVSSVIRAAAASVSFITWGRGRLGLAGVVVVISVIYSVLAEHQSGLVRLHHMFRTRRASSLMRSGVQAGSQTIFTLTWPTPGTLATAFS